MVAQLGSNRIPGGYAFVFFLLSIFGLQIALVRRTGQETQRIYFTVKFSRLGIDLLTVSSFCLESILIQHLTFEIHFELRVLSYF